MHTMSEAYTLHTVKFTVCLQYVYSMFTVCITVCAPKSSASELYVLCTGRRPKMVAGRSTWTAGGQFIFGLDL